jgi:hypothetical protein
LKQTTATFAPKSRVNLRELGAFVVGMQQIDTRSIGVDQITAEHQQKSRLRVALKSGLQALKKPHSVSRAGFWF